MLSMALIEKYITNTNVNSIHRTNWDTVRKINKIVFLSIKDKGSACFGL